MELTLNPTLKQHLAWEKWNDPTTRFILFGGGAGGGKSWWIAEKRLVRAYQYPGIKSFIARKELKRLMASTYITFTKVCQNHKIPASDWKLNGQYNFIEFSNGSRIDLLDVNAIPSDPLFERFGSLEYTEGDIEEAGEVDFMAFDVLKTRVGRHRNEEFGLLGKIGLTANPTKNWVYRVFYRPFKDSTLPPQYAFIQSLYQDNPYTKAMYGGSLAEITDSAQKQRLMFGNWEYDDDPATLIKYEAILDLFTNHVEDGGKYLTADIARYGQDRTIIGIWEGHALAEVVVRTHQGIDETIRNIRDLLSQRSIPYSNAIIDEDGIGGGVVDGLRGVKGYIANSTPLEGNFKNLKAQCCYKLADFVNEHKMAITAEMGEANRQSVIEELGWIKSKDADKDGKRQVIPKDEIKEQLGKSPDFADMITMRMYFDLKPTGQVAHTFIPGHSLSSYPAKNAYVFIPKNR
jgi:hypothetical protein